MRQARLHAMACALLLGAWVTAVAADNAAWLDAEGRIQYGFYTEDAPSVAGVLETLSGSSDSDPLHGYYVALANYRIAQIEAPRQRGRARGDAERCDAALAAALDADADAPELLALQSACSSLLATLSPLAPLSSAKASSSLRHALKLAPKNPRVLLVDALEDYDHSSPTSATRKGVIAKLQKCVAAFEVERVGNVRAPGWGAAEAYAYLARSYLDLGDPVAARGALEHALLIVPEFAFARRMLRRITTG